METVHQKNAKVFKAVIPCHYREDCVLEYPTGRTDTEFIKTIHAMCISIRGFLITRLPTL